MTELTLKVKTVTTNNEDQWIAIVIGALPSNHWAWQGADM